MPYHGLNSFIKKLEESGELIRIREYFSPDLEITDMADRITKSGGPALLFENNGTAFPLLINTFGSEKRMALSLCRDTLDDPSEEIEKLFTKLTSPPGGMLDKLRTLPALARLSGFMPKRLKSKGKCQQVVNKNPDLSELPVLKCWPYDGGKFITLPVVNTYHPVTLRTNAGMYRMQILDKNTTGMHWQLHKTGANHFNAWKNEGKKMPVSVILGGDPVYTYAATAPLPENIDEYMLAGFLRHKRVELVKCITNDIYVPSDADIVIEGYVDPAEDPVWEGPFGDHTGFYSLADWYPKFHVTCITHSIHAVYPATIVGIPPMEDAWLAKATEKIFLAPIKLTLQPEIEDLHMPDAGVAHNLAIVKIRKSYPGQGMKVINSLLGAGQMMFTKYLVVVSGDVNIRDYHSLFETIFSNTDLSKDLVFLRGPLDVLDHSSDTFASGGKLGIDATSKMSGERPDNKINTPHDSGSNSQFSGILSDSGLIKSMNKVGFKWGDIFIISINQENDSRAVHKVAEILGKSSDAARSAVVLAVDHTVDVKDLQTVAWQVLGNSDPQRDHFYAGKNIIMIDGTIKYFREGGFSRRWPNVVCADESTVRSVDGKYLEIFGNPLLPSPSLKYMELKRDGREEIGQK